MNETVIATYSMQSKDGKTRIVFEVLSAGYGTRATVYQEGHEPITMLLDVNEVEALNDAIVNSNSIMQHYNS